MFHRFVCECNVSCVKLWTTYRFHFLFKDEHTAGFCSAISAFYTFCSRRVWIDWNGWCVVLGVAHKTDMHSNKSFTEQDTSVIRLKWKGRMSPSTAVIQHLTHRVDLQTQQSCSNQILSECLEPERSDGWENWRRSTVMRGESGSHHGSMFTNLWWQLPVFELVAVFTGKHLQTSPTPHDEINTHTYIYRSMWIILLRD